MDALERLRRVEQSHDYNCMLTVARAGVVRAVGSASRRAGVPLLDEYEHGVAPAIMLPAFAFYKNSLCGLSPEPASLSRSDGFRPAPLQAQERRHTR